MTVATSEQIAGAATRQAALVGIDWGTSSIRAYLLSRRGDVLEAREGSEGVLKAASLGFGHVLARYAGDWWRSSPGIRTLMCGMIGSRQGWLEAPYVECPAGLADLALVQIALPPSVGTASIRIVPGLRTPEGTSAAPDVMRGEETELMGAFEADDASGICVLPGTHSKWARLRAGKVTGFDTYMTGELFALLRDHSILGRLMTHRSTHDVRAFELGVVVAWDSKADQQGQKQGLLHQLFSVRTLGLFGRLPPEALESYLSGLLIGSELAQVRTAGDLRFDGLGNHSVRIIGNGRLAALYAQALALVNVPHEVAPADAAARGLWRIASASTVTT